VFHTAIALSNPERIARAKKLGKNDFRSQSPRFQGKNFYKNLQLVEQVKAISAEKNVTPSQLALAWLLAQGQDIVPILVTKRRKYLGGNAAGADITLIRGLGNYLPGLYIHVKAFQA
jgi:aryl-alcohol dehydrogenase-like predicted oxidoreductase